MIYSGVTDFSKEDIKFFIRTELKKDEDEIDTDYVDMLTKLLAIKQHGQPKKKTYYRKSMKFLIATAIIIALLASALTVSAQVFNFNIPQKIVQFFSGKAEIDFDLENADTTADDYALLETDLAMKIAEFGITPITFPEEMIKEDCEITKINDTITDKTVLVQSDIYFVHKGHYGVLTITQFLQDFDWTGYSISNDVLSGQMIKVNGMDVLIFERENSCSIRYKNDFTIYDIYLECDIVEAIQFAKSIK